MSANHGERRFTVHKRHGEYGTTRRHLAKLNGEFTAPLRKPRMGQLPG